jgi:hypothetical protein
MSEALPEAGAEASIIGQEFEPHVVVDRALISSPRVRALTSHRKKTLIDMLNGIIVPS